MTPAQFLSKLKRQDIAPAYLFLGPELYERRRCRARLLDTFLSSEDREEGVARHDLNETSLVEVTDDARSLSLFAPRRVILASNAESALPRTRSEDEGDESESPAGTAEPLAHYMKDPSPGVVLIFEAARHGFEGEDKKKLDRVRKFYSPVADAVEMRRFSVEDARLEAQTLAQRAGVALEPAALELLLECLAADMTRIAVEIEKLALYRAGGSVSVDDIAALVPDARATTIFVLVGALGRRDRARGLHLLDTLVREGEYMPLALAFLATQFRYALAAKEAKLRGAQQIQTHFSKTGAPMWPSRAEQISQTLAKFSGEQLERGLQLIFEADRDLRSARPDDRIVMERFVLALTA